MVTGTPWRIIDSRTGVGNYKMSLDHLVVPENKEMLTNKIRIDGSVLKGNRSPPKELFMAQTGTIKARK